MQNQFTTVTTSGYGSDILSAVKGVLFGILFLIAASILLYWNEGRADLSVLAKTAVAVSPTTSHVPGSLKGKLVSITGTLSSNQKVGDVLFLNPGSYLAVQRKVEMYAWVENQSSTTQKHLGGSSTTTTTYTYQEEWTFNPPNSSNFKYPQGHTNPSPSVTAGTFTAGTAQIGSFQVNLNSITLPPFSPLNLTSGMVKLNSGDSLISNGVYVPENPGDSLNKPQIGDLQVQYSVIPENLSATILGEIQGNQIVPYFSPSHQELYRIFNGTKQQAVETLHHEYVMLTWLLRGVGFAGIWLGLFLCFSPIRALLDVIPFLGNLTGNLIGLATFFLAAVLTLIIIAASILLHHLLDVFLILLGVIVLVFLSHVLHHTTIRSRARAKS
jgi:hypothetical protein